MLRAENPTPAAAPPQIVLLPHFLQRGIVTQALHFAESFRTVYKPPRRPLRLASLPAVLLEMRPGAADCSADVSLGETPAQPRIS